MTRFTAFILALATVGATGPAAAAGQPVCAPREQLVSYLADSYKEAPASKGLTADGTVMEIFVSPSGTFTVAITQPRGISCIVAVGENWDITPMALGPAA